MHGIEKMSTKQTKKYLFPKFMYFCSGVSVLIMIWMSCHLFVRSCGGPFPNRTRGPFAKYRYYKLAEIPEWENQITPDPTTGKTRIEELIENGLMPPLKFGAPKSDKESIGSATPSATVK